MSDPRLWPKNTYGGSSAGPISRSRCSTISSMLRIYCSRRRFSLPGSCTPRTSTSAGRRSIHGLKIDALDPAKGKQTSLKDGFALLEIRRSQRFSVETCMGIGDVAVTGKDRRLFYDSREEPAIRRGASEVAVPWGASATLSSMVTARMAISRASYRCTTSSWIS